MIKLKEGDIDLANGYLYFPHPKEKKYKSVPILQEDVEILRSFGQSVPGLPFFRHDISISGATINEQFGPRYLYKWWVKACNNLGIEGVDLYGGTRHSSARALRAYCARRGCHPRIGRLMGNLAVEKPSDLALASRSRFIF